MIEAIAEWLRAHGFTAHTTQQRPNLPWEVQVSKAGVIRYPPSHFGRRQLRDLYITIEEDEPHLADFCTNYDDVYDGAAIDLTEPDSLDKILAICNVYLVDSLDKLMAEHGGEEGPDQ